MDFILELIKSPEFASWLALAAFVVSGFSYYWTKKATELSQQALESAEKYEAELKRSELIRKINDERAMLKEALLELGVLKANFDVKPDRVKNMLVNYSNIFTSFMPTLEQHLKSIEFRLEGAAIWQAKNGATEYLQIINEQEVSASETAFSVRRCFELISQFKEKLSEAEAIINAQ